MAHRWQVAQLVDQGLPYHEVAKQTGASTTTVTRVAHWLRHGGRLPIGARPAAGRTGACRSRPPEDRDPGLGAACASRRSSCSSTPAWARSSPAIARSRSPAATLPSTCCSCAPPTCRSTFRTASSTAASPASTWCTSARRTSSSCCGSASAPARSRPPCRRSPRRARSPTSTACAPRPSTHASRGGCSRSAGCRRARRDHGRGRGGAAAWPRRRDRRPRVQRHTLRTNGLRSVGALFSSEAVLVARADGDGRAPARARSAERRRRARDALPDAERARGGARTRSPGSCPGRAPQRRPARRAGHGRRARAVPAPTSGGSCPARGRRRLVDPAPARRADAGVTAWSRGVPFGEAGSRCADAARGRMLRARRGRTICTVLRASRSPPRERRPGEMSQVARILEDVRERGDVALREWALELDGVEPAPAQPAGEIPVQAIQALAAAVRRWHALQRPADVQLEIAPGVELTRRCGRSRRSGSTCRVGSCRRSSCAPCRRRSPESSGSSSPRRRTGRGWSPPRLDCSASRRSGPSEARPRSPPSPTGPIPSRGSTRSSGPGTPIVNEAKLLVSRDVAIDLPAGPSEIVVLAGPVPTSASPAGAAAQAEHGADAVCRLIIVDGDSERALAEVEALAPEHLVLLGEEAEALAGRVRRAGSVFVGRFAPSPLATTRRGRTTCCPPAAGRSVGGLGLESVPQAHHRAAAHRAGACPPAADRRGACRRRGHARAAAAVRR